MLPTNYGSFFLNTTRSIHENGHRYYNKYIFSLILQGYTIDYVKILI